MKDCISKLTLNFHGFPSSVGMCPDLLDTNDRWDREKDIDSFVNSFKDANGKSKFCEGKCQINLMVCFSGREFPLPQEEKYLKKEDKVIENLARALAIKTKCTVVATTGTVELTTADGSGRLSYKTKTPLLEFPSDGSKENEIKDSGFGYDDFPNVLPQK